MNVLQDIQLVQDDVVKFAQDVPELLDDNVHELELGLLDQELSNDHFRSDEYIAKKASDKMADIWS